MWTEAVLLARLNPATIEHTNCVRQELVELFNNPEHRKSLEKIVYSNDFSEYMDQLIFNLLKLHADVSSGVYDEKYINTEIHLMLDYIKQNTNVRLSEEALRNARKNK